ncbi:CbiQ family ECF transporter T component [Sulfurirhabdus autotrophica]|uniref:Cobalt transport protein n=1 Tax=Sulfurirhabdus autotrophica TaxID=1706046 RepID=A0A4R3YEG0_9PROT|nr:CbiQ family ECF transporter T component [Sulfurirhabdus autotrophica]TCV90476.1 cobalt transport protein [Sulfurirhabdus autotrophica]
MSLHAATKIAMWLILAIFTQWMQPSSLLILSFILLVLLVYFKANEFSRLIRRTRYLLISLLLIYGYATPGELIYPAAGIFSPSLEGLQLGYVQAWRLLVLLAGLALLFRTTPRNDLLSGLYILMTPLKYLGVNVDKIAVRIWLTLQYADLPIQKGSRKSWREVFEMSERTQIKNEELILTVDRFNLIDLVAMVSVMALVLGLLRL